MIDQVLLHAVFLLRANVKKIGWLKQGVRVELPDIELSLGLVRVQDVDGVDGRVLGDCGELLVL